MAQLSPSLFTKIFFHIFYIFFRTKNCFWLKIKTSWDWAVPSSEGLRLKLCWIEFFKLKNLSKKGIGSKIFLGQTNLRSKYYLGWKNILDWKSFLGWTNFWIKKNFGSKKFSSQKNFRVIKFFGSNKFLGHKKFWVKKNFGSNKFLVPKILREKKLG